MPRQNEIQAMFPAGSRVIRNPHGTAPGIDLEVPRRGMPPCRVFCLPGVPAEMTEMWHGSLVPAIIGLLGPRRRVIRRRQIHCFGAGESQIEALLPDMIRRGRQPLVGITASQATVTLRIAAEGETEEQCYAAMEPTVATIRQCLGTLVFGEEGDKLQHAVVGLLRARGKTLATAEGATAGLLAQWLGGVEGAAQVYRGGLVVMAPAEPAEVLANRCREQFAADYGLAVGLFGAGVAPAACSPAGCTTTGGGQQPLLQLALASGQGVRRETVSQLAHPELALTYVAKRALNLLRLTLIDDGAAPPAEPLDDVEEDRRQEDAEDGDAEHSAEHGDA